MSHHAARVGREPSSGLYFEILGPEAGDRPPILFVHGGGSTGDHFRATPDGRVGWADLLAENGYQCWVTDWPATGRSGYRDLLQLRYTDVVAGYEALLKDVIGRPVVVICHSMGGPTTWKLIEQQSGLIAGVISIAAGYPGNLASQKTKVLKDDGDAVTFEFGDTGVEFTISRKKPFIYDDAYVFQQGISTSRHFPMDAIDRFRGGLSGISPLMVLERVGATPGLPMIDKHDGFAAKPIRHIAGSEDPAHTREIEDRTRDLFNSWGADAKTVWLPDRGLDGNGHFLMLEKNSDAILEVIQEEIEAII